VKEIRDTAIGLLTAAIAYFAVKAVVIAGKEKILTPSSVSEMRKGYSEVASGDKELLRRFDSMTFEEAQRDGSRTMVQYATNAELQDVYILRSEMFQEIASDSSLASLHPMCLGQPLDDKATKTLLGIMPSKIGRIIGRTYAYRDKGQIEWTPSVDFERQPELAELLLQVLNRLQASEALQLLAGEVTDASLACRGTSQLYGAAGRFPDEAVGSSRLIDVVRALEYLNTTPE